MISLISLVIQMTERIKKNKIKHKIFNHFNLAFRAQGQSGIITAEEFP